MNKNKTGLNKVFLKPIISLFVNDNQYFSFWKKWFKYVLENHTEKQCKNIYIPEYINVTKLKNCDTLQD